MKTITIAVFLIVALSACNSSKTPKDAKVVPISAKTASNNTYTVANFSLQLSANWQEESPSNNMRLTQFRIKEYPEYQVVVSYFGNMDNKVEANVNRWKKQFSVLDKFTQLETTVKNVTAIKLSGTYKKKPFPMSQDFVETPNYGTLAAIVPSSEGPYFLKLTAPINIIDQQESSFIDVLNSYTIQ